MQIKCGTDLISCEKIKESIDSADFIEKVFHSQEIYTNDIKRITSVYALKESLFKALDLKKDENWLNVEVFFSARGKPKMVLNKKILPKGFISLDCSIAHMNDLTQSVVMIIIGE